MIHATHVWGRLITGQVPEPSRASSRSDCPEGGIWLTPGTRRWVGQLRHACATQMPAQAE